MSSGSQNAQNFAAIISSMVLGPSFFDHFPRFPTFPFFLRGEPPLFFRQVSMRWEAPCRAGTLALHVKGSLRKQLSQHRAPTANDNFDVWVLLHTGACCCILVHAAVYCCKLLHTVACCCIMLDTAAYCCILLHTVAYCCTLLHTVVY